MALPMNDDFTNFRLPIEELEAVAGGNVGGAWNSIQTQANSIVKYVSSTTGKTVVAYKCGINTGGMPHNL